MIIESILNLVYNIFFNLIPDTSLDFSMVDNAINIIKPYTQAACYVLPVNVILVILAIQLAIWAYKLIAAVLKMINNVIPFF